jgi:tetratricopeptide (TPR) repeat protein
VRVIGGASVWGHQIFLSTLKQLMLNLLRQRGAMECPVCSSNIQDDSLFCRVCGTRLRPPDGNGEAHTQAVIHPDSDLMIGSTFLERYRIVGELGRGGMGVVYKAEDMKLRRSVALKFLPPDLTRDPAAKERFIHEAQAASALDHPGICTVHEIEETKDGRMFISMGCYEGETLKDRIAKGPLEVGEALDIAAQVAEGLEEAHERGIVHRDMKPSNIIVTPKGQAKIMDFGLAKLAGQTRITKAGTTMGTIAYMSPEQARGEDIDHRTDIWSLGVVLHEMLTGEQPFKGEYDQAVIYSILNEDPRSVSEINRTVPAAVGTIVARCLKKDTVERYQSTAELVADLASIGAGGPLGGYKTGREHAAGRAGPKMLKVGIPVAVLAAVAILFLVRPELRGVFMHPEGGGAEPAVIRATILPSVVEGGTVEDRAFCDGLIREVTGRLRELKQLRGKVWVLQARDLCTVEPTNPTEIRKEFGINVAVSSKVRRYGDKYELTWIRNDVGEDIEGGEDHAIVKQRYSRSISDPVANLSTWQDSIVVVLCDLLGAHVDLSAEPRPRSVLTVIPRAYISLLTGMGYLNPSAGEPKLEAAIESFEAATKQDPSYAAAYSYLGWAYFESYRETGDTTWAGLGIEIARKALETAPGEIEAHLVMAEIYRAGHDNEKALTEYQAVLDLDSGSLRAAIGMGKAYTGLGRLEEATEAYRRAVGIEPLDYESHHFLGYTLYRQGRYEEAMEPYEKMVELRPYDVTGYTSLGGIYFQLGHMAEARDIWERSLAVDTTLYACSNLGTVYFMESRYVDAARMYRKALAFSGDNYLTMGALAESYFWIPGGEEEAKGYFEQAIALAEEQMKDDPDDAVLLASLAGYYGRLGKDTEARRLTDRALQLNTSDPSLLVTMADTYEQIGERELALDLIRRAFHAGVPPANAERFPGLSNLRADPRYRQILKAVEMDSLDVSSVGVLNQHAGFSSGPKGGEENA